MFLRNIQNTANYSENLEGAHTACDWCSKQGKLIRVVWLGAFKHFF